jgi:hypothetical protein
VARLPGGEHGFVDDFCHHLRLRDHRQVPGGDVGNLRISTRCHERKLGRRDRPVLGTDDRPGGDGRPGGRSRRCREGVQGKGALDSSEDRRFRRRYVVGEAGVKTGVVGPRAELQVKVVVACRLGGIYDEIEDVVEVTPALEAPNLALCSRNWAWHETATG